MNTSTQTRKPKLECAIEQQEFFKRYPRFMNDVDQIVKEEEEQGHRYAWINLHDIDDKYLPFIARYLRRTPKRIIVRTYDGVRDNHTPMAIELFW